MVSVVVARLVTVVECVSTEREREPTMYFASYVSIFPDTYLLFCRRGRSLLGGERQYDGGNGSESSFER